MLVDFSFLQQTSLWPALSELGKRISTPPGVLVWGARAEQEVKKDSATINATVGIAQDDDGTVSHLPIAENFMGTAYDRVPKGKIFGYAPIPGVASLRQKWKERILRSAPQFMPYMTDPVVTNGITHSLYIVGQLFLNPGETLLIPEKSWENYYHTFENLLGIQVKAFTLFADGKFSPAGAVQTAEGLIATQKKIILLLNFPHNQTGYTPSTQEISILAEGLHELCRKYPDVPFVVILDDAYDGYVYDDNGQKYSAVSQMFAPFPNLSVVKLDGASKVMLAYGSRVGFISCFFNLLSGEISSADITAGISKEMTLKLGGFVRGEVSQINHHGQIMTEALMDHGEETDKQRQKILDMLMRRWRAMMVAIQEQEKKYGRDKIWADPCNSGFFCFLNLMKGFSPTAFVEKLIAEERLVVFPAESDNGLRVAFCSVSEAKIGTVIEKIYRVANS